MVNDTPPRWDRSMQQRLIRGEAAALGELYDRFASLVHSLAHRVLDDDRDADFVTGEVFGRVWENPSGYDPRKGSMRSWIAGLAQSKAVERLRWRCERDGAPPEQLEERVRAAYAASRADYIRGSLPSSLRTALDLAYRHRHDYRRAAAELGVTADEARRRLRLGLQLLSTAAAFPLPAPEPPAVSPPSPDGGRDSRRSEGRHR